MFCVIRVRKKKIYRIYTNTNHHLFSHWGEEMAVWGLYFMVAVGRKFLWILFREIRHATLKLQTVLRKASPVHRRCQRSQQCSESKAL